MAASRVTHAILVAVEDARRASICMFLRGAGYRVGEAPDGPSALKEATIGAYDLVLLDCDLPWLGVAGVLAHLRRDSNVPIIVLTGRTDERERVGLLDLGADDCVTMPCSLPGLEARIRAVLRRGQPLQRPDRVEHGELVVDHRTHRVHLYGVIVDLTPKEFDLLAFLAGSPDQVFTREELLEYVWGSTHDWQDPATVTEHVRRLRLKIEPDPATPRWLHTVRGVGYCFADPGAAASPRGPGA